MKYFLFILALIPLAFKAIDHPYAGNQQVTIEKFNPSLEQINSVSVLEEHVNQIVNFSNDKLLFAHTLDSVLMERFYHGYSTYQLSDNYIARIAGDLFGLDFKAIVLPDDILKHPNAACSQQAMVFQAVLKNKGIKFRKVGFYNKNIGHFCTEVQINGTNYFFDSNEEAYWESPEKRVSAAQLVQSKELLARVYTNRTDLRHKAYYMATPIYGEWNSYPAKNARLFHRITNFVCNYDYLILFGLGLIWFAWYKRKKERANKSKLSKLKTR